MQLQLVCQYQLQHGGTGIYCLLDYILLGDVRDWRFTPPCIPLALLRLKPFRGYLCMTHLSCGFTEKKLLGAPLVSLPLCRLDKQSTWRAHELAIVTCGHRSDVHNGALEMVTQRVDHAMELGEDCWLSRKRLREWLGYRSIVT